MRTRLVAFTLLTLATVLSGSPHAWAQNEIHHLPPLITPGGDDPDFYHPFMDTTAIGHDYQFFAPADIGSFGGADANYGWFLTYDRVNIWVSRPNRIPGDRAGTELGVRDDNGTGDWTWGNRFEVGFMTEEDHGWQAGYWHIDGPGAYDETHIQRVNVLQPADIIFGDPSNIDLRGGGGGMQMQNQALARGVPTSDANNPLTQTRAYILGQSINVADITNFELNKTLRWKPTHSGIQVEPFFGLRYIKFINFHERQDYNLFDGTTGANVGNFIEPPSLVDALNADDELFIRDLARFDNHMLGLQFGARFFKQKSRWLLSGELRAFALQNLQYLESLRFEELTYYSGIGVGTPVDRVFFRETTTSEQTTEFVYGGEIRAEAAYEMTRDLSLRFGTTIVELAQGVGRGNSINFNSEQVTLVGLTVGIDFKR